MRVIDVFTEQQTARNTYNSVAFNFHRSRVGWTSIVLVR